MLKKTITYTDFNGVERTETFYFNLTKAELVDMEASEYGYSDMLKQIIDSKDTKALARVFKEMVLRAYGEKSPDGRHFMKSPEIADRFAHTQAYSDIYMSLATNTEAAVEFANGIIPKDVKTDESAIRELQPNKDLQD